MSKIYYRGVFIERQLQGATGTYLFICHTGICKFLPYLYATQDEAKRAVDERIDEIRS